MIIRVLGSNHEIDEVGNGKSESGLSELQSRPREALSTTSCVLGFSVLVGSGMADTCSCLVKGSVSSERMVG